MTTNEVAKVYETVLSSPGMNESIKLDMKVNRKTVLLLNNIIERGLEVKNVDGEKGLPDLIPAETISELKVFAEDCLKKAGLSDLNEKIKTLNVK